MNDEITLTLYDITRFLGSHENINNLPTIEEIYDYFKNYYEVFTELFDDSRFKGFEFILKDGTECNLTYEEYKCILHSHFDYLNDKGVYIYSVKNENIYICADCLTFLKAKPEIINKYELEDAEKLLFPEKWVNEGIEVWCKKRELKHKEYEERRELRESARQERVRLDAGCWNCANMRHDECIYDMDSEIEEEQEYCDCYERR